MGIYNTDSLNILNEVYFGQTKGITEVFEKFCDFRDKYITNRKVFFAPSEERFSISRRHVKGNQKRKNR